MLNYRAFQLSKVCTNIYVSYLSGLLFKSVYFHISFAQKSIPNISVLGDNSSKFRASVFSNE